MSGCIKLLKELQYIALLFCCMHTVSAVAQPAAPSHPGLRVPIRHLLHGAPLEFHKQTQLSTSTQVMFTRIEYIVSNLKAQTSDGEWIPAQTPYFHINPMEEKSELLLDSPTSEPLRAIAFSVGVPPDVNHADPARWPVGHPLNVLECNLHWSWQAGYVFLALEGASLQSGSRRKTFLYHLGNDGQLMNVELALPDGSQLSDSEIIIHLERIWTGPETITPADGNGLTHSAAGDQLAPRLARNVMQSFELRPRAR